MKNLKFDEILDLDGIKDAIKLSHSFGINIYLVGGAIRNFYLNKKVVDFDLIVDGKGEKFAHCLASKLKSRVVLLGKENFQTFRIPYFKINLDIWDLRGQTILEDLWRRDFTINAIAYNLQEKRWLDPTNGFEDLKKKVIRWVNPSIFEEDPLRMLRAFRFLAQLKNFSIEEGTLKGIFSNNFRIQKSAVERILYELDLIFSEKNLYNILILMDECKLLNFLFPEIINLKNVEQNIYHPDNCFDHTLNAIYCKEDALNWLYKNLKGFKKIKKEEEIDLSYALLLHDTGKPSTRTEDGLKVHFYGHEKVSETISKQVLLRLRFPNKRIERISSLIRNHMRPLKLTLSPYSEKALRHFIYICGENIKLQIALFLADYLSKNTTGDRAYKLIEEIWELYKKKGKTLVSPKKLVSGEEVMEILNLKPSKEVGKVLQAITKKQVSGEIKNKREALKYLKSLKAKN